MGAKLSQTRLEVKVGLTAKWMPLGIGKAATPVAVHTDVAAICSLV